MPVLERGVRYYLRVTERTLLGALLLFSSYHRITPSSRIALWRSSVVPCANTVALVIAPANVHLDKIQRPCMPKWESAPTRRLCVSSSVWSGPVRRRHWCFFRGGAVRLQRQSKSSLTPRIPWMARKEHRRDRGTISSSGSHCCMTTSGYHLLTVHMSALDECTYHPGSESTWGNVSLRLGPWRC